GCVGRADAAFDLFGQAGVALQEFFHVLTALAQALVAKAVEGATLAQDAEIGADVHDVADAADALVEHDVELGDAERRRDLVLDDLHAHAVADHVHALLDRLDAPDLQ